MAGMYAKALIVLVTALVLVASAAAAVPSVAAMNLQAADVPGAKLVTQRAVKAKGFIAAYDKRFSFAKPSGPARLVELESKTQLAASPALASTNVWIVEQGFRSTSGRQAITAALAKEAKVAPKDVTVGAFRKVAGYDEGFELSTSVHLASGRVYKNLVYLRLDRVVVFMFAVGPRPIRAAVTAVYAGKIAGHVGVELAPRVVTAPTLSGTAQQGQMLTATPGAWTVSDVTLAYQWQRCDPAGASCVDVAGATSETYAVSTADAGRTLRVVVTATSRFGSATGASTETAIVA